MPGPVEEGHRYLVQFNADGMECDGLIGLLDIVHVEGPQPCPSIAGGYKERVGFKVSWKNPGRGLASQYLPQNGQTWIFGDELVDDFTILADKGECL